MATSQSLFMPAPNPAGLLSGGVTSGDISPNSVVSGTVGSGAILGAIASGNRNIASGTIGGFDLASGQIANLNMGSGSISSGNLASGQIGGDWHFGLAVNIPLAMRVSGFLDNYGGINSYGGISVERGSFVAKSGITLDASESGFIVSGFVGDAAINSGSYASGSISAFKLSSGVLTSGIYIGSGTLFGAMGPIDLIASGTIGSTNIASGQVLNVNLASGAVTSGIYASGSISQLKFASGIITSGVYVGSGSLTGAVGPIDNIASGTIGSTNIGSGQIQNVNLASGAVTSGNYASGSISNFALSSGILSSGNYIASGTIMGGAGGGVRQIVSGSINSTDLASGVSVAAAQIAGGQPVVSGSAALLPTIASVTAENISGQVAICFNHSGQIVVAMAATSGRWPAVGVSIGNALSGLTVPWQQVGPIQFTSGMADYSGYGQRRVFLGRSGQVTTISGAWSSGGFASGDRGQPLGVVINSGGVYINVQPVFWSGGPLGVATGGAF